MANTCSFQMLVKGKISDIDKFIAIAKEVYRIYYIEPDMTYESTGDSYVRTFYGDCAWSGWSSFIHDRPEGLSLPELSKSLGLEIEYWTEEEGIGFEEHFLAREGEVEIDDCFDVGWFHWDREQSFEDWSREIGVEGYKEAELDENDDLRIGWREWEFELR